MAHSGVRPSGPLDQICDVATRFVERSGVLACGRDARRAISAALLRTGAVKRELRLRRPADFERVRAGKRSWFQPLLVLYALPNGLEFTRVGVSVGKRVAKAAVVRNRVRRRIREAVRLRYPRLRPGYDLVFIARAPSAEADWAALSGAVERALRRARLLQD